MATRPTAWPFATPMDMLAKAYRDVGRLIEAERAANRDDAIDGAINACVAAWHVADIVFAQGLTSKTDRGTFNAHLRKVSPEIHICRDIAEFYKHLELTRSAASIDSDGVSVGFGSNLGLASYSERGGDIVDTKVPFAPLSDTPATPSVPAPEVTDMDAEEVEVSASTPSRWVSVKIRLCDGSKRSAVEVVEKAIHDWERLLKSGGL